MDYKRIYDQFIVDRLGKCPFRGKIPGMERHHIVSKCQGGTREKANLVNLSYDDHVFAHLLLARIYGGKLSLAFSRMVFIDRYQGRHTRLPHKIIMADARFEKGSSRRGKPQHPNLRAAVKVANAKRRGKGMHPNLYEALKPIWAARVGLPGHPNQIEAASRKGDARSPAQKARNDALAEHKRNHPPHQNSVAAFKRAAEIQRGKPWSIARRAAQNAKQSNCKGVML